MRAGVLLHSSIGDYRLVDFVGSGGMGEVYRAVHSKIGRVVAIKVLSLSALTDGTNERFINEARLHARLYHPRIATLFDFIEADGRQCIVMEYVDGRTLDELIRSAGSLSFTESLRIFEAVVEAVGYVHTHSIVHRDIKPNNIKVAPNGEIKLLDFGIAKGDSSPNLTQVGNVVGTLKYLSPEQLGQGISDARSDVWALGILLYEMITGQVPFDVDTVAGLLGKLNSGKYAPASTVNFMVPKDLDAVVSRCLQKNPSNRYQSAEELLKDVRRLRSVSSEEVSPPAPLFPKVTGKQQMLMALGIVLLAMIPLVYFVTRDNSNVPAKPANTVQQVSGVRNQPAGDSENLRSVRIQVMDGEAEVYRGNQKVGVTPYDLEAPLGQQIQIVLKRNGFAEKRVEFSVSENKNEYSFSLAPLSQP